jgi:hypothetical protein
MNALSPTPYGSWSFIVTALADLGRAEIERQQRAAEIRARIPAAEDQTDDEPNTASTMSEVARARE